MFDDKAIKHKSRIYLRSMVYEYGNCNKNMKVVLPAESLYTKSVMLKH